MVKDPNREFEILKSIFAKVASFVALSGTYLGFFREDRSSSTGFPLIHGDARFNIILIIGVCSAIAHGILWSFAERLFGWEYEAGGQGKLPSGFSAFVLSLTLTVPLSLAPIFYQIYSGLKIVHPGHFAGSMLMISGGAIGHLIMYGVKSLGFRGVRAYLMPPIGNVGIVRAVFTELVYAFVYFSLIVIPYHVALTPNLLPVLGMRILFSALFFITGMAVFICVRYPKSLADPTWVQARGFFSGLLLPVCLCVAMYSN